MKNRPSHLMRAAIAARRGAEGSLRVLTHGVDALTLGLFSDAWIDELTARHYGGSDHYRGDSHNMGGLFDWEDQAITATFPVSGRILVTSAGAGRESLALLRRGYDVVATECTPELHEVLTKNLQEAPEGRSATALLAAPDHVPPGPFASAVIGWAGYTHLVGHGLRTALLRRLAEELQPGAPVLISYLGVPHAARAHRIVASVATALRAPFGGRPIEPGETTLPGCYFRYFMPGEVAAEVSAQGFRVVRDERSPYPHLVALTPETRRARR